MRIISTFPVFESPTPIHRAPAADELIKSHPVTLFFTASVTRSYGHGIVLVLKPRDSLAGNPGEVRSLLGCVVDCATRLAGANAIGVCDLSEYELTIHSEAIHGDAIHGDAIHGDAMDETLLVTAHIEAVSPRFATCHCTIQTTHAQTAHAAACEKSRLIAEAQGTLVRRMADK